MSFSIDRWAFGNTPIERSAAQPGVLIIVIVYFDGLRRKER
jgi:hypothetical protein